MAFGMVIAAIGGAVVGGVVQGVTAYKTNEEKVAAYENAANTIRESTNKYSGNAAKNTALAQGAQEAKTMSDFTSVAPVAQAVNPGQTTGNIAPAIANASNVADNTRANYNQGWNMGQSNAGTMNAAKYNADLAKAGLATNQADINYNVQNQTAQEALKGVANTAQTANNIFSDERLKDDAQASVEDALRQIDSINYKYKPETGLDQDEHVGVTAQSVENTALDNGMVSEDENGYKQLDKQKLMESIFAAQAALQKQIDALKEDDGKFTSDERCKDIEKKIESGEELSEDAPEELKEEAEQLNDDDKRNDEVNNEAVEKAVKKAGSFLDTLRVPIDNEWAQKQLANAPETFETEDVPEYNLTDEEANAAIDEAITGLGFKEDIPEPKVEENAQPEEQSEEKSNGIALPNFGSGSVSIDDTAYPIADTPKEETSEEKTTSPILKKPGSFVPSTSGNVSSASMALSKPTDVENPDTHSNAGGSVINTEAPEMHNDTKAVSENKKETEEKVSEPTQEKEGAISTSGTPLEGSDGHTDLSKGVEINLDDTPIEELIQKALGDKESLILMPFKVYKDNSVAITGTGDGRRPVETLPSNVQDALKVKLSNIL